MRYAVFDIETRVDKPLLNRIFFAGQGLDDEEAYARFRADLIKRQGDDFPPLVLHVPISIALGDVSPNHALRRVESLALDNYAEPELVREFWRRLENFNGCLVSFNGRQFDLPVLELQALRRGLSCPAHFSDSGRRRRYADTRHLDLLDFVTNYGVFRLRGGMNALLKLIGMPGKETMDGSRVQQAYEAGRLEEIHRYCRSDVVQTYFLFLRVQLLRGEINEEQYRAAAQESSSFLQAPYEGELGAPFSGAPAAQAAETASIEQSGAAPANGPGGASVAGTSAGHTSAEKSSAAPVETPSAARKN
jgi:predicted PolB exonuclease-like 3'-5' exonuclease